jgi:FtsZ-interacting cell division protein YlmF
MEKFWLFGKKGEPKEDIDTDYDDIYYGTKSNKPDDADNAYGNAYDDTDMSDVNVVISSETASAIAKAEEPWLKRTFTPESYTDGKDIVDAFKDGRIVVICVEELDRDNFVRLFDYLMGAVQALDGSLRREDRETVVLLPYDFDEETSIDELDEEIIEDEIDEEEELDGEDEEEDTDDETDEESDDEDAFI